MQMQLPKQPILPPSLVPNYKDFRNRVSHEARRLL